MVRNRKQGENTVKSALKSLALNPMITTEKSGVALFIQQCYENGMKNIVCSPGSRNAPIIIAIDEHPEMKAIVIHDERSAGFFAMGMAQQLGEPVGVVCTSGSAMLNYYPAVAEAYYQSIPLIIISADRPKELVNQGDGQTIVQLEVYKNHILAEEEIKEYVSTNQEKEQLILLVNQTFDIAKRGWKGPVHFNLPISEPLYRTVLNNNDRFSTLERKKDVFQLNQIEKELIRATWKSNSKKLILCGQMDKNGAVLAKLNELAVDSSVAILVENTANLKSNKFVHCIDRTLMGISESEVEEFLPDILITIGGAVVSKKIKEFLRNSDIKEHWRVGHAFPNMDTYKALTHSFECSPFEFLTEILKLELQPHTSTFGNLWKQKDFIIQDKLVDYFPEIGHSDLKTIETILDYIPENSNLHMGNSSVVRYCQLFDPIGSFNYFSNRGTSGIDGSTSTSAGVAFAGPSKCNVIITGDISFFYDSNALWNDYLGNNLKIVLINNSGGGIFKIIEGPSNTSQLSKYFEAKHNYKARDLCKGFGVEYFEASTNEQIENSMEEFYADSINGRPKLIEIFTPSDINDKVLKQFFNFIKLELKGN